jgi:hypothetical protein
MLCKGRNIQFSSLLPLHYSSFDILVRQILVEVGINIRMDEEFCQSLLTVQLSEDLVVVWDMSEL